MKTADEAVKRFSSSRKRSFVNWAVQSIRVIFKDTLGATGLILVAFFILMALFAPVVAPHGPFDVVYKPDKTVARLVPPNLTNLLGTTNQGMDVFQPAPPWLPDRPAGGNPLCHRQRIDRHSGGIVFRLLWGVGRPAPHAAHGYSLRHPFLALCHACHLAEPHRAFYLVILLIVLFLWRTTARVIRSQVLTLKERPFIWAARAAGVSDLRILFIHIGPNVLPSVSSTWRSGSPTG